MLIDMPATAASDATSLRWYGDVAEVDAVSTVDSGQLEVWADRSHPLHAPVVFTVDGRTVRLSRGAAEDVVTALHDALDATIPPPALTEAAPGE